MWRHIASSRSVLHEPRFFRFVFMKHGAIAAAAEKWSHSSKDLHRAQTKAQGEDSLFPTDAKKTFV